MTPEAGDGQDTESLAALTGEQWLEASARISHGIAQKRPELAAVFEEKAKRAEIALQKRKATEKPGEKLKVSGSNN